VLASDGVVLTNKHVVEGATAITATDVGNRHRYPVTVLGRDRTHDVALLALDGATGLFTAPLGDSSAVAVGDRVDAIGNADGRGGRPLRAAGTVAGLDQTVSAADDLTTRPELLTGLIQITAALHPGDSGGPLVNSLGQVVGIDTAAGDATAGAPHGQGYAIPINEALELSQQWSPTRGR
jgi:S1-C subfamily serine protease